MRAVLGILLLIPPGCASRESAELDVFPGGAIASPWRPERPAWSGSLDEAIGALEQPELWRTLAPRRVYLAPYVHEKRADRRLKARIFEFDEAAAAERAFRRVAPSDARPLRSGDEGCWTSVGVCARWGARIVEVFGPDSSWDSQVQSAFLLGLIERRLNEQRGGVNAAEPAREPVR